MSGEVNLRVASEKLKIRRIQRILRFIVTLMGPILILTIALCWWKYPETFDFLLDYISVLGLTQSLPSYLDNTTSMIIFISGFVCIAIIAIIAAIIYIVYKDSLKYATRKSIYAFFLAFGAIFVSVPADVQRIVHGIGAFLFIFGFALLNFALQALRFFRKRQLKLYRHKARIVFDIFLSIVVFLVMILFLLLYFMQFVPALAPYHLPEIGEKVVLIVDCFAIFLIDVDDM